MKVAFLISSLAPGGAERQLATLAVALAARGESVTVLAFRSGGALEAELRAAGISVLGLGKGGALDAAGFLIRLARRVRAIGPDVVHAYLPTANLAALAIRPFAGGARIVWGVRASYVDAKAYGPFDRLVYAAERRLARRADLIIVNSHRGRARCLADGFPASRTVVVPNGIDTERFAPDPEGAAAMRRAWGIKADEIVIGIAARLDPMKDHETYLRAAAIASKAGGNFRFVCVGGGAPHAFERLRARAGELGIADKVVFAGHGSDMPAAYSAFDIAACASVGEGFPNMVAEAMACGVPVVATDVGDCAEIVGDTGWILAPRDSAAMARLWCDLASLPAATRAEMGAAARSRIRDRYGVAALAGTTTRVLSNMLSGIPTDRQARILFPFVGDSVGGSHRSAVLLIRALDRSRFEPVVLVHRPGPLVAFVDNAGVAFQESPDLPIYDPGLGRVRAALRTFVATPRLALFLRRQGIALVHVNDARMSVTWAFAARLARRRIVLHQRTRHIESRLMGMTASRADRIIAISRFTAATLPAKLQDRAVAIDNPFDTATRPPDRAASRAAIVAAAGLTADRQIVAFVGTLQAQKRPFVFIEAAAWIAARARRPVAFLMFGRDGEGLASQLRERAERLGLSDSFHWLGYRADIETALAASDLVLAPEVDEGFGRVLVEAALAGTPVVAARSGGHPEIIADGENGRLVAPDDPEAFATTAIELLDDDARRDALARRAQAAACARYAPESHARAVAEIYDALLRPRRADVTLVIESLGGGGAQHVAAALANRWASLGRRVAVVTFLAPSADAFPLAAAVQRVVIGGVGDSPSRWRGLMANLHRVRALRRALRRAGAPVAISFVGSTNVLLVAAAIGLGVRTIVSERNDPRRQVLPAPWNRLRRLIYRCADVVTANSAEAIEALAGFVPRAKLRLLPNPRRAAPPAAAQARRGRIILAVGRLHAQKGFDVLLDGFAAAAASRPGWRLEVLGDGALGDALAEQARQLGISDRVTWRGFVADPFPFYDAADLFVLPSRHEGTSNALMEAMSRGLAPVVSDAASRGLVTNEGNGLVVPAENAAALAAALGRLMDDGALRDRLGAAARDAYAAMRPDRAFEAWDRLVFRDGRQSRAARRAERVL